MATPITWQNINAPSLADASRPLEAAQRSFNGMFGQLGEVLAQREQTNERNWQNDRNNNTQAFLDRLASFRTPEELAAAQQSGALAQFQQSLGANIDRGAVRGAADQRLGTLRTNTRQAGEFDDFTKDRAERIIVDDIRQTMLRDPELAKRKLTENGNLFRGTELARELDARGQVVTERGRDTTRFTREGEKHVADLSHQRAQEEIARGQLANSTRQVGIAEQDLSMRRTENEERRQERISAQISATALAKSKLKDVSLNSAEGQETMAKYVRDNFKDPAIAASLLAKANSMAQTTFEKDGKAVPITVGAMMQAVGSTLDTRWGITKWLNDSDQADDVQENLEQVLRSPTYKASVERQEAQSKSLDSELARLKSKLK